MSYLATTKKDLNTSDQHFLETFAKKIYGKNTYNRRNGTPG